MRALGRGGGSKVQGRGNPETHVQWPVLWRGRQRAIEAANPDLKDVLPKTYDRFDNALLSERDGGLRDRRVTAL